MREITVRCPSCDLRNPYRADNPFRPFCSERCRTIDLGAWAEERYRIPGATPPTPRGSDEPDGSTHQ